VVWPACWGQKHVLERWKTLWKSFSSLVQVKSVHLHALHYGTLTILVFTFFTPLSSSLYLWNSPLTHDHWFPHGYAEKKYINQWTILIRLFQFTQILSYIFILLVHCWNYSLVCLNYPSDICNFCAGAVYGTYEAVRYKVDRLTWYQNSHFKCSDPVKYVFLSINFFFTETEIMYPDVVLFF